MKTSCLTPFLSLAGILLLHPFVNAQQPFKSGHQPGDKILAEFHSLNVTGKHAGTKRCLVCDNGLSPVVMIFARSASEPLMRLLVELDTNAKSEMGSFVVFVSDDADLPERLKQLAEKHALKHVVMSVFPPAGPDGFHVARDADVTVVLYREFRVGANHAFKKGELNDQANARIIADLPKILEKKKAK